MRILNLLAALFVMLVPASALAQRGEVPKIIPDATAYRCGQYLAFPAPWSISSAPQNSFVRGVDYADTIKLLPSVAATASCLDGATIEWMWPTTTSTKGVYGYMELTYGNYDGGIPTTPVAPIQVSAINTFRQELQISALTGNAADFNILNEFYLTTSAGVASSKVVEIGFFENISDGGLSYFNSGAACSTYTDPTGRRWTCRWLNDGSAGRYIMFYSGGQVLNTTIDFKAVITSLVSQSLVSSSLWLNGVAVGVEPVRNSGTMTVGKWMIVLN